MCLIVVLYLIKIAADIGDAATSLFINNSVTFDKLGSFNGLTMSVSSAARYKWPAYISGTVGYHIIWCLF